MISTLLSTLFCTYTTTILYHYLLSYLHIIHLHFFNGRNTLHAAAIFKDAEISLLVGPATPLSLSNMQDLVNMYHAKVFHSLSTVYQKYLVPFLGEVVDTVTNMI